MTDFVTINRKSVPVSGLTGGVHLDLNDNGRDHWLWFDTERQDRDHVTFKDKDEAISVYDQLMALLKKQGHTYLELK